MTENKLTIIAFPSKEEAEQFAKSLEVAESKNHKFVYVSPAIFELVLETDKVRLLNVKVT